MQCFTYGGIYSDLGTYRRPNKLADNFRVRSEKSHVVDTAKLKSQFVSKMLLDGNN